MKSIDRSKNDVFRSDSITEKRQTEVKRAICRKSSIEGPKVLELNLADDVRPKGLLPSIKNKSHHEVPARRL